jgi:SAM-dependent methyltransferase
VETLDSWINALRPSHRVLDFGCGAGSFPNRFNGQIAIGVDVALTELAGASAIRAVCAKGEALPFADGAFDLVVCHHSLEHIDDLTGGLSEIRRVMKSTGRLYVSVPDGYSFSDRLYRALLCGGGHVQRFSYTGLISLVSSALCLRPTATRELYSSFIFIQKASFVAAPSAILRGPLPRRMRWIGHLPSWSFRLFQLALNVSTRFADKFLGTHLARYGWEFAFQNDDTEVRVEKSWSNVCVFCGSGASRSSLRIVSGVLYRCGNCRGWNIAY